MTRHARGTIALALATATGEAVMQALVTSDWSARNAQVMLYAFLVGPLLFLALLAWRRRTHPGRSRLLFGVAVVCAIGGLGVLGFNLYRFHTDPGFRRKPNMYGLIVPLVQWCVIVVVWLGLVIQEAREKRAAQQSAQPPVSGESLKNPSQSA
jgi:hypothetical protein